MQVGDFFIIEANAQNRSVSAQKPPQNAQNKNPPSPNQGEGGF